jgi:predicted naringenin-chalcone synthase
LEQVIFSASYHGNGAPTKGALSWNMFIAGLGVAAPPQRYTQRECWDALQKSDVRHSTAVLREFGNLSSPTVFFVLERALHDTVPDGL